MSTPTGLQHHFFTAATLALAATAAAQDHGAAAPSTPTTLETATAAANEPRLLDRATNNHDWTVRLEPAVWLVSPSGSVRLPGASSKSVRIEQLNIDTPEVRPSGEIHLSTDRWRLSFFGSEYDQRTRFVSEDPFQVGNVDIDVGDTVQVDFDFTIVEAAAGYRVWTHDFDENSSNFAKTIDADLQLYLIGGLRLYDIDFDVREIGGEGGRSATDQLFIEPIIGVRGELELMRDFTIDLQMSGGGYFDSDRTTASVDIVVGFQWRPHPNVGVQIGWRQVAYWLDDGDGADAFEYNGGMAGIQGGLVIRF